jgi:hypothetical protein
MDGRSRDEETAKRLGRNLFMARRRAGFSQEELGAMGLGVRADELLAGIEWIVPAPTRSGSFSVRS